MDRQSVGPRPFSNHRETQTEETHALARTHLTTNDLLPKKTAVLEGLIATLILHDACDTDRSLCEYQNVDFWGGQTANGKTN